MKAAIKSVNMNNKADLNTLSSPLIAYIKVTSFCMLKCSFCSQSNQIKESMTLEDAKTVLYKLKKAGIISIVYTGGEPLLHDNIVEILQYGYSLGFEQILVTNLLNLKKNLKALDFISSIGVSLHGKKEIHDLLSNSNGVFDKVIENIDFVLNNYKKIKLNINCTITDINSDIDNLNYLLNFVKKRNIDLCLGRLNYIGSGVNYQLLDLDKFLPLVEKLKSQYENVKLSNCIPRCMVKEKYKYMLHACGAGITMISVNPNCDITICPSSSQILGNLKNQSFNKIWNCQELKTFRNLEWLSLSCKLCKDFESCKGGCHSEESQLFWKENCDSFVNNKFNNIWDLLSDNPLQLKESNFRVKGNEYIVIKSKVRKIDHVGFQIFKSIDSSITGNELMKKFSYVKNIKDFLISAYIDGILEVKNEKKSY